MPPLVVLQAVGGQCPVSFQQAGQDVRIEAVFPGPAGLAGAGIGQDQQVRHGRGPCLLGWLEVVDVLEIAKQVNLMPISA
jgi:hypothetical protein